MTASIRRFRRPCPAIAAGAVLLRVIAGVGFANYDTLYALAWGGQLSRGSTPAYDVPIAPTPHPLVEALGLVLAPLGPRGVEYVTVALGFLALSACGWVIYRLGAQWFGWAAGALAALIFLTRVPRALLRRARVHRPPLPAARARRAARRVAPPAGRRGSARGGRARPRRGARPARGGRPGRRARARAARARRAAAPGGVGVLRALLAVPDGSDARLPARTPRRRDPLASAHPCARSCA